MEKLDRLVEQAKSIILENSNPDRMSLWRAYVALEYAILDLKLRYGLEGNPPPKPAKSADLAAARSMVMRLDLSSGDKKKLLYDMRSCRNVIKALVASKLR
ncbi:MAG: hypothetical protein M3298_02770 [Thermoproteota archaeon]|nr:hypothetical protein [Thermoproteota archaeon]MDQ3807072.1 hypothetical protein [Thermoproteota archaeon]MDQ3882430.1 hypothetical protein [Thermoproteota archaeon]MDQ5843128.1 hypothetical protein [Thermoproteota archaeon]